MTNRTAAKRRPKVDTRARPKTFRETMARRVLRDIGRRCADGDPANGLAYLLGLRADLDQAMQVAVDGMRAQGFSWAQIAEATGATRQAAFKRWGQHDD